MVNGTSLKKRVVAARRKKNQSEKANCLAGSIEAP